MKQFDASIRENRFLLLTTTSIPITQMPVATPNEDLIEEEDDANEQVRRKRKRARLSSSLRKATRRRRKGYAIIINYIRVYDLVANIF